VCFSCYNDNDCKLRVQSIQRSHQTANGWADIGYHFLVGENGKVYEGRGWNREAAHSPGFNTGSFGKWEKRVCLSFSFRKIFLLHICTFIF